jgi:hypothetical protein
MDTVITTHRPLSRVCNAFAAAPKLCTSLESHCSAIRKKALIFKDCSNIEGAMLCEETLLLHGRVNVNGE